MHVLHILFLMLLVAIARPSRTNLTLRERSGIEEIHGSRHETKVGKQLSVLESESENMQGIVLPPEALHMERPSSDTSQKSTRISKKVPKKRKKCCNCKVSRCSSCFGKQDDSTKEAVGDSVFYFGDACCKKVIEASHQSQCCSSSCSCSSCSDQYPIIRA